jgi:hypothetical protein
MSDFLADITERSLSNVQTIRPRPLSIFEPLQAVKTVGLAEQPYRQPEFDTVEMVRMAADVVTNKELPEGQDEGYMIAEQSLPLSKSIAMAGPKPALSTLDDQLGMQGEYGPAEVQTPRLRTPTAFVDLRPLVQIPVEQQTNQGEYRLAMKEPIPDHAPSIVPKVPAADTVFPAFEIKRKSWLKSPDGHQTSSPSLASATHQGIDKTGQNTGIPDQQTIVVGSTSKHILFKPAIERVETEKPVAVQQSQQRIVPLPSRLEAKWEDKSYSLQKEKATPTIHVTIGRIEVRATPAPVQNKPKPKAQDPLSLDDYLRRRNGGGR